MKEKEKLKELQSKKRSLLSKMEAITREQKQDLVKIEKEIWELQAFINAKPKTDN